MNFSKGTTAQAIDHSQRRLMLGLLFSIAFHALLLAMQFGVPGLGLPSLEMPWNKRSAEAPPITIDVNDVLPPLPSTPPEKPEPQPESELDTLAAPPEAPPQPSKGFTLVDPRPTPPPPPAPAIVSKAAALASAPTTRRPRDQERKVTPIIAKELANADNFYVPAVDSEDKIGRNADLPEVANGDPNGDETLKIAQAEKQLAEERRLAAEQQAKEMAAKELATKEQAAKNLAAKELAAKELAAKELAAKEQALAQAALQREAQERAVRAQEIAQLAAKQEQEKLEKETQQRQQAQLAALAEEKRQQALRQAEETRKLAQLQQEEEARKRQLEEEAHKTAQRQLEKQQELAREQARIQAENEARAKASAELAKAQADAAANAAREAKAQADAKAREAARATANATGNASSNNNANNNASNNGKNNGNSAGNNFVLPKNIGAGDLLDNAKAQLKGLDLSRNPAVVRSEDAKTGRRSVFGSLNQEVPVRMYVEAWQQKIERNGRLNYSQLARDRARGDPIVSVTIRSDGSLDDITILHSSGRSEIDEAVRRIVRLNSPFAPFPKNIAARYDLIEIRRVWSFDETLKLIEEIR